MFAATDGDPSEPVGGAAGQMLSLAQAIVHGSGEDHDTLVSLPNCSFHVLPPGRARFHAIQHGAFHWSERYHCRSSSGDFKESARTIGPLRPGHFTYASSLVATMTCVQQAKISEAAAACVGRAASFLAACARPALTISGSSTPEELCSALTDLVAAAELFGCKPSFWRWAGDAASLLGRSADAETYRARAPGDT